jgi:hypothetical protein
VARTATVDGGWAVWIFRVAYTGCGDELSTRRIFGYNFVRRIGGRIAAFIGNLGPYV